MSETTRKYYIDKAKKYEKASDYKNALASYMEAFSITEMSDDDNPDYFSPGYLEDTISLMAYRMGDFATATSFGTRARIATERKDNRINSNTGFFQDALLTVNPKWRLESAVTDFIREKFDPNIRILDVGPNDGRWSFYLKRFFNNIDAVEVFEPYVEKYDLKNKYNNVFVSDINDFEFDYYDLIILGDVLEHIEIEKAQKLVKRLNDKCGQLIIIVPYEFSQDEVDKNEYQIHRQEDLTKAIMQTRYPELDLLMCDEARGVYIKKGTVSGTPIKTFSALDEGVPKTYRFAKSKYDAKQYGHAAGVFRDSIEEMSPYWKTLSNYYCGLSYKEMGKHLEALRFFSDSVKTNPAFKSGYLETLKILEKNELWSDMEYYLKKALEHIGEDSKIEIDVVNNWKGFLLVQTAFVLSRQNKAYEAFGYADLALNCGDLSDSLKETAQYNWDHIKKQLWGTLQI